MQGTKGAFSGRGAQSALLAFGGRIRVIRAYGGHETGLAVYRRLFTRTGYALDRLFRNLKAPAAAGNPCANQTLSSRPFYRAKMPVTATPVVHGNRPACRMLQGWMTALGGRGDVLGPLPPGGNSPPARTLPTFGQDRK